MLYNDDQFPNAEILSKMNNAYNKKDCQVEVCEIGEYRQLAELEEIFKLLNYCEEFFKWLEGKDGSFEDIKKLIDQTKEDKVVAESCCGKRGLDYRYGCCDSKDFNKNCNNYCKCEMEILDKVIKLLTLRNSIVDKECMIRLAKNRMDMLRLIFNKYSK